MTRERRQVSDPASPDDPRVQAGDFKARCLELMDRVAESGVEYTITKRGRPVAKLVPCEDVQEDGFGFLAGTVVRQGDIVSPDLEAWAEGDESGPPGNRPPGRGRHPREPGAAGG